MTTSGRLWDRSARFLATLHRGFGSAVRRLRGLGRRFQPGTVPLLTRWSAGLGRAAVILAVAAVSVSVSVWLRSQHELRAVDAVSDADAIEIAAPKTSEAPIGEEATPQPASHPSSAPPVAPPPSPDLVGLSGELGPGQTLGSALRKRGVPASLVHEIDRVMRPHFDFRRAKPGHHYELELTQEAAFRSFAYQVSALERYRMVAEGDSFRVWREEAPIERRVTRMAGVVTSSLYQAVLDLGEESQVASDFASIFAWNVDFSRAVQPGDQFRVLYERNYLASSGPEQYLGPGRILAASYAGHDGHHHAIYYEVEPGRGSYYHPDGQSVQRSFLLAPLNFSRISSRFSHARYHPILKVKRPHHGIDYAAPYGTPVWSVADGKVIHKSRAGGFGRLVKIRHRNGYVSYYAHLSRYAAGLRVGQPVRQKQVIGYVGQSGLATGPHVCFRVRKNGRYVNPAAIDAPAADPIPRDHRERFAAVRDARLEELGPITLIATDEAL